MTRDIYTYIYFFRYSIMKDIKLICATMKNSTEEDEIEILSETRLSSGRKCD